MANNFWGAITALGVGAVLWALIRPKEDQTVVTAGLGAIQVAGTPAARPQSHQLQKGPGDQVVVAATFSVSAKNPAGQFITWPYKFFVQATAPIGEIYSNMSPAINLPKVDDQVWAGEGFKFFIDPTKVVNGDLVNVTVQIYGAVPNPLDGSPGPAFSLLASKPHLDAIKYVAPPTQIVGSLSTVNVTARGPFRAPPPFRQPGRKRPFAPPPSEPRRPRMG